MERVVPMIDLSPYRERVESRLDQHLTMSGIPRRLLEAMRYSVLGAGKRIRAALVYLSSEAAGAPFSRADNTACAVEMVHAYSLIHDDLPCMDDDDLRRGQPTCHVKFDEATAVLAGDALQAAGFEAIASDTQLPDKTRLALISRLASAIGPAGMVGGQMDDLESEHVEIGEAALVRMHRAKTGALISASVVAGGIIGDASASVVEALNQYGYALGLAFQVKDDILDAVGDTAVIGKRVGVDATHQKTTFVSMYGLDSAIAQLETLRQEAIGALDPLGEGGKKLRLLADFVADRDH